LAQGLRAPVGGAQQSAAAMRGRLLVLLGAGVLGNPSDQLAASVAAHTVGNGVDSAERANLAAALKAGAGAYEAAAAQKANARREQRLSRTENATQAAVKAGEAVSKEVQAGQEAAAKTALQALRAAQLRSPSTALGKKAHELETSIQQAEQTAAKKLEALDEVKSLEEGKHKAVEAATAILAKAKKTEAQTAKEAELAEEVAKEKKEELTGLHKQTEAAEKALEAARTEEEAVSAMEDKKRAEKEAAAKALAAEETEAAAVVQDASRSAEKSAQPARTEKAKGGDELAALKAENARLKAEKAQLAKKLQQEALEKENAKLSKETEDLEKKVAAKPSLRKTLKTLKAI